VIHRIWLGSKPMPDRFDAYAESWRRAHEGWEQHLWTDDDIGTLEVRHLLERARNHGERADLVRYEVLWRFGGVYVDVDVECLRPIDDLVAGLEAFAGYERSDLIGNAVLGAAPGHPAFARALELARHRVGQGVVQASTGPGLVTEVLPQFPDVKLFGRETFYPYGFDEKKRRGEQFPGSYAVHHWDKSWETPWLHVRARLSGVRVIRWLANALRRGR
jgi:mannosyltransferase OCH1-like enzyme